MKMSGYIYILFIFNIIFALNKIFHMDFFNSNLESQNLGDSSL